MKQMIKGYDESCKLVKARISELTQQRNELKKQGDTLLIDELDLDRRIRLLYAEHIQMKQIIDYLNSYVRRVEERAET